MTLSSPCNLSFLSCPDLSCFVSDGKMAQQAENNKWPYFIKRSSGCKFRPSPGLSSVTHLTSDICPAAKLHSIFNYPTLVDSSEIPGHALSHWRSDTVFSSQQIDSTPLVSLSVENTVRGSHGEIFNRNNGRVGPAFARLFFSFKRPYALYDDHDQACATILKPATRDLIFSLSALGWTTVLANCLSARLSRSQPQVH